MPVLVLTKKAIENILQNNPYRNKKLAESEKIYFSFLASQPTEAAVLKLNSTKSPLDEIMVASNIVYILCRGGYGKTVFSNTFIEKKLGFRATTRNLETTLKLLELTQKK